MQYNDYRTQISNLQQFFANNLMSEEKVNYFSEVQPAYVSMYYMLIADHLCRIFLFPSYFYFATMLLFVSYLFFIYLGNTEFHIMKVQHIHVYILKIHKVSAQYNEYLILIFVLFYFYIHHGYIVVYFLTTFHSIFYFSSIS